MPKKTSDSIKDDYREPGSEAWDGWLIDATCMYIGMVTAVLLIVAFLAFGSAMLLTPSLSVLGIGKQDTLIRGVIAAGCLLMAAMICIFLVAIIEFFGTERAERRCKEQRILWMLQITANSEQRP